MAILGEWQADRDRRRRAAAFVRTLHREPEPADVAWLAKHVTLGDTDHAAWELRYARRALGFLVAQRDALDDRTASLVARELSDALSTDPHVAVGMLALAERQLNARLAEYRRALAERTTEPAAVRLARVLLAFAGDADPRPEHVARCGVLLGRYLDDANADLRQAFGVASLPEDLPPSEAVSRGF
jgi:hypothetical protein